MPECIYTGTLKYRNIEFQFVLNGGCSYSFVN